MRAFVAVDLADEEVLGRIQAFQRDLEASGADLKLVEKDNLHFTVKFLGEISQQQASEADGILRGLTLLGGDLEMKGAGAFPNPSRPSVVWVGVADEDAPTLKTLAETVIGALKSIGENDDRAFQAHLTIARVRSGRNREALVNAIGANSSRVFGKIKLEGIKLKSSVLTPRGPVYSDVGVYTAK